MESADDQIVNDIESRLARVSIPEYACNYVNWDPVLHAKADFVMAVVCTTMGDLVLELFPTKAPRTVENFCKLAQSGYYNGNVFHNVIGGFLIQTGDPTGTGFGGECIWGGQFEDEFSPELKHDAPYVVSMANIGPNTNASQFFITLKPAPQLDNKHTVFGKLVRGSDIAHEISLGCIEKYSLRGVEITHVNIIVLPP